MVPPAARRCKHCSGDDPVLVGPGRQGHQDVESGGHAVRAGVRQVPGQGRQQPVAAMAVDAARAAQMAVQVALPEEPMEGGLEQR